MAYVIAEPCIDVLDVSCVSVCPVDCIHFDEGTDRKLFIDPNECIDCGACEPECPVNAIFPEESLPPEWAQYTQIDATWYTDKAAARTSVDELKPRALNGWHVSLPGAAAAAPTPQAADADRVVAPVGDRDRVRHGTRRRARRRDPRVRLAGRSHRQARHDPQRLRPRGDAEPDDPPAG